MKILKTLARVCVHDLDTAVRFYEQLTGVKAAGRFAMPAAGLELAVAGEVRIIAGTDEALQPFRTTDATFLVESLEDYRNSLESNGGIVLHPPQKVPTGMNMTVRHPDGSIFEYVEHR